MTENKVIEMKREDRCADGETNVYLSLLEIEDGFNKRSRRNVIPDDDFVELIRAQGVQNPIHVRRKEGHTKLLVVDGHRRLLAASAIETIREVPVIDHGFLSDEQAIIKSFHLNCKEGQKPFNKRETIDTVQALSNLGMDVDTIAKELGKKQSCIRDYLSVTKASPKLAEAAKKEIEDGGVSPTAAARAASLPKKAQDRLAKRMSGKSRAEALKDVKEEKEKRATPKKAPTIKTNKEDAGGTKQDIRVLTFGEKREVKYKVASDYKERCQRLEEEVTKRLRRTPSNKQLLGMSKIIACIKGRMKVEDVFRWDGV